MKPLLATLFLAAFSMAQDLSSLPSCATTGAANAITSSGCATTDIACICKSSFFTSGLEQYAKANCGLQDYNTVITMGQALCASAGVTLPSSTSATTMMMTGSSSNSNAVAAGTATTNMMSSMTGTANPMTMSDPAMTCTMCCSSMTATMPAVATYSGAAAARLGGGGREWSGMADVLVGAVALVGFVGL